MTTSSMIAMLADYRGPLIAIASLVASAVIGSVFTHWFRARKRPRLAYRGSLLQRASHPKVQILFDGERIESLYSVRFCFWNHGSVEIRESDLPRTNRPAIRAPDGARILSVQFDTSNPATAARITSSDIDTGAVGISFDFLNPADGVRGEILYTMEKPSGDPCVTAVGTIIGAREIKSYRWSRESLGSHIFLTGAPASMLLLLVWTLMLGLPKILDPATWEFPSGLGAAFGSACILFLVYACGIGLLENGRSFYYSRVPDWVRRHFQQR